MHEVKQNLKGKLLTKCSKLVNVPDALLAETGVTINFNRLVKIINGYYAPTEMEVEALTCFLCEPPEFLFKGFKR